MDPFSTLESMRTLLVDDDELIRDSISLAFANKGCFLRATETAEEGLQALKDDSFDVIISDLKLPGMDGLEFFKLLRASCPNTVKILITAYGDKEVVSDACRIGIHEFISKPFSVKTLLKALSPFLENGNGKKIKSKK